MKKWFASILVFALVGLISSVAYAADLHESKIKKESVSILKSQCDIVAFDYACSTAELMFYPEKLYSYTKGWKKSGTDNKFVCPVPVRSEFSQHYIRLCSSTPLPKTYPRIKYKFSYLNIPPNEWRS